MVRFMCLNRVHPHMAMAIAMAGKQGKKFGAN
jgi:hypothetical protein